MKKEFNEAVALTREKETEYLTEKLTPEQRSDYDAFLQGQAYTRFTSEQRMAAERPRLEEAAFQKKMQPKEELDNNPIEESMETKVRRVRESARLAVDAHEERRRAAREELAAEGRWRFVKSAELERDGIDPKSL